MPSRGSALSPFLAGCLVLLFASHCGPEQEFTWIDRLKELGMADCIGNPDAQIEMTVIMSLGCDPCRERWQAVYPAIRSAVEAGDLHLTLVAIMADTEKNRAILEARAYTRSVDDYVTLVLFDDLVQRYSDLDDTVSPQEILALAGIANELGPSGVDWSARIEQALAINAGAGLSLVPVFLVNGVPLSADNPFDLKQALEDIIGDQEVAR